MSCSVCNHRIDRNDSTKVKCVDCGKMFHSACVSSNDIDLANTMQSKLMWKCNVCEIKTKVVDPKFDDGAGTPKQPMRFSLFEKIENELRDIKALTIEFNESVNARLNTLQCAIERIEVLTAENQLLKDDLKLMHSKIQSLENSQQKNVMESDDSPVDTPQPSYAQLVRTSHSSSVPVKATVGTGQPVDTIKPAILVEKWYLYVSRIHPSVSPEAMIDYVCSKLGNTSKEDVNCKLLLPKDRIIDSTLTYISFKIGLKEPDFNLLSNSDMWPPGVIIRPFVNHPRRPKNGIGLTHPQQQL